MLSINSLQMKSICIDEGKTKFLFFSLQFSSSPKAYTITNKKQSNSQLICYWTFSFMDMLLFRYLIVKILFVAGKLFSRWNEKRRFSKLIFHAFRVFNQVNIEVCIECHVKNLFYFLFFWNKYSTAMALQFGNMVRIEFRLLSIIEFKFHTFELHLKIHKNWHEFSKQIFEMPELEVQAENKPIFHTSNNWSE